MLIKLVKEYELPYGTTKCTINQSELEIRDLFTKYGINMVQITQIKDKYYYKFVFKENPYLIEIPDIYCLVRTNSGWTKGTAKKEIALRFLLNFLKTTFEQAQYTDAEQLLLSYRIVKNDEGKFTTVGKLIDSNPKFLLTDSEKFDL